MTLRNLLIVIAAFAVLLAFARFAGPRLLGRRPGMYYGRYWYFDEHWKYHETRGTIITVTDKFIFTD
jgi:hypothetical protein